MKRRITAMLIVAVMLLGMMPGTASATELPPNPSGSTTSIPYGDSMYSNYGTINGVSGKLTLNSGKVLMILATGIVTYNHTTGTVGVNRGFLEVNQGKVDENNSTLDENNGTVTQNYVNGIINKNEKTVTKNYGVIKNNNYNGVITDNEMNASVHNNSGTINENYGVLDENAQSGRVNYNRGNGKINKNTSTVYNNSGSVYNNSGYIYSNSGYVTTNTGTVYNISGYVTTNTGTVYQKFNVSKPSEVTDIDYESGFQNYGGTMFFRQGSTGKIRVSVTEGYEVSKIKLTDGILSKNAEGVYTITNVTSPTWLSISVEKKSAQQEGSPTSAAPSGSTTPEYSGSVISPSKPASLSGVESAILSLPNDSDPAWSSFSLLRSKGAPKAKRAIRLSWKPVNGATGYIIYGNRCGKKNRYEKIVSVSGTSWVQKNLKMGTYYKYLIAAVNGSKVLAVSKTIHVATKGGQVGNNTKVTLNQKKKTLRVGKTIKLKATLQKGSLKVKIHRKVAYESDNPNVAIVSKGGKVKAVGKGTCYIYAYAQNGVFAKCRIKVK